MVFAPLQDLTASWNRVISFEDLCVINQALRVSGSNPLVVSGLPGAGTAAVIVDVWANLPTPGGQRIGDLFWATDRTVLYLVESVSGANAWVYVLGTARTTFAAITTGLGTNDAGFLNFITDYSHTLRWDGSAWTWAPGDDGSGYYRLCESAPAGFGASAWQTCDGSTVARLNADGTTTNVTVPDVTTAAYLKGGLAAAAIAAASGASGAPSATTTVDNNLDISTVNVGSDTHTHGAGTLELRNKQVGLYFRR